MPQVWPPRSAPPGRVVLVAACGLVFVGGCATERAATSPYLAAAQASAPPPTRPHDPFVLRSVLDGRPRIVTAALDSALWVAYDATTGTLYKAWSGGVDFEGAVYTRVHGPQPTTVGAAYTAPDPGGWHLATGGQAAPVAAEYLGYRVDSGRVTLRYALPVAGAEPVVVEETPEFARGPGGEPGLVRRFRVLDVPAGAAVALDVEAGALRSADAFTTDGGWAETRRSGGVNGAPLSVSGRLTLRPDGPTTLAAFFSPELATLGTQMAPPEEDEEGDEAVMDRPSVDTAPGALPDEPAFAVRDAEGRSVPLEPGVSIRLYDIDRPMASLGTLVAGQTPNVSRVDPALDLRTPDDYGGIAEQVMVHAEGFLAAEAPGTYGLRLLSDDGGRLVLNGEVVIDHDGTHAYEPKDVDIELTRGLHAFEVWHFQNEGGAGLTLAWRPPGAADFAVVPTRALRTSAGEVRVTAPGRKLLAGGTTGTRPGDGEPLVDVHPSYDLMTVRPEAFQPRVGGMDFLSDGRLAVCNWEPDGGVYLLDGVQGNSRAAITAKRIAAGLAEPLGLAVVRAERVGDGRPGTWGARRGTMEGDRIFVLQKQELTELVDADGDETADEYRVVADDWGVTANFHEFAFGLEWMDGGEDVLGRPGDRFGGHFYATLATAIDPGGRSTQPQNPDRGRVLQIAPDGAVRMIASGLRTPNGVGRGVGGRLYVADNQGDWLPASKIVAIQEGGFYGNRSVEPVARATTPEVPPVVWLPQNEIGNSPSQPAPLEDGPYAGQMIHGEVTHGGVKRVFVEEVDGVLQGAVFRFTQGLEAGINRLAWGPDGALYVGGIGSSGNWGQEGKKSYGLQRLRYAGRPTFEMLAVRAMANGLEIEMTEPLATAAVLPEDVRVMQWRYVPTEQYGGPKVDERPLDVRSITVSDDRRKMFVELDEMEAGHVVHVRLGRPVQAASGRPLWATEAWYTLNRLPADRRGTPAAAAEPRPNTLTAAERRAGWRLLFDGRSMRGFRGYGRDGVPAGWQVRDGAVAFVPGTANGSGDLVLPGGPYSDFELALEWKIGTCGNSGIFYRGAEGHDHVWRSAPEMQVLDNTCHPDSRFPSHTAGSNYDLHTATADVTRAAGAWNQVRIVARGGRVEHWLNGTMVAQYEQGSPDWTARVAASKFRDMPDYGRTRRGVIALQDHGDPVWYRNLKIRPL